MNTNIGGPYRGSIVRWEPNPDDLVDALRYAVSTTLGSVVGPAVEEEKAPENAQTARVIVELDERRGHATVALVPFWDPDLLRDYSCCGLDVEYEWCLDSNQKIVRNNVIRMALADMLQTPRRR